MTRFCAVLLLFLSPWVLLGAQELSTLLEGWFAAESAFYENTTDVHLALEKFQNSLENFTGSLLFSQYEKTGILQGGKGELTRQNTAMLL